MGSTAPSLKKLMKTQVASTIVMYQSSKRKVVQGATQKTTTGKRLHRMRPSAAQVNNSSFPQNDVQLLIPFPHSYQPLHPKSVLGAELLPQAFDSASTRPSSADPQEDPILVETTDVPKTTEDVSPSILSLTLPKYFLKIF